jgi:uncharacterized cupredoxin-like copper-binding protein
MSVRIEPVTDHEVYHVNGKTIYKDSNNDWKCNVELTVEESKAFLNYVQVIIENKDLKKHPKATYKG